MKRKRKRLRKVEFLFKEVVIIEGHFLDAIFFKTIKPTAWDNEEHLNIFFTCNKGTAEEYLKENFDLEPDKITTNFPRKNNI